MSWCHLLYDMSKRGYWVLMCGSGDSVELFMTTNTDVSLRVCTDVCMPHGGGSRDSAFLCTTRPRAVATAIYPLLCCRGDWVTKEVCVCVCGRGSEKGPCYLKMIAPSLPHYLSCLIFISSFTYSPFCLNIFAYCTNPPLLPLSFSRFFIPFKHIILSFPFLSSSAVSTQSTS